MTRPIEIQQSGAVARAENARRLNFRRVRVGVAPGSVPERAHPAGARTVARASSLRQVRVGNSGERAPNFHGSAVSRGRDFFRDSERLIFRHNCFGAAASKADTDKAYTDNSYAGDAYPGLAHPDRAHPGRVRTRALRPVVVGNSGERAWQFFGSAGSRGRDFGCGSERLNFRHHLEQTWAL